MSIFDLFYPKKCFGCGKEGKYFCDKCLPSLQKQKGICPLCTKNSIDGLAHFACQKKLGLDQLIAPWQYKGPIKKAILSLKYKFSTDVARELIFLTNKEIKKTPLEEKGILVAIPTTEKREKWRGFNQTAILGRLLAEKRGWFFKEGIVFKKRGTRAQTGFKKEERIKNAKNAFGVIKSDLDFSKNTFFVFDDVWTTGATMREVGKLLKKKGAKKVIGLAIAK